MTDHAKVHQEIRGMIVRSAACLENAKMIAAAKTSGIPMMKATQLIAKEFEIISCFEKSLWYMDQVLAIATDEHVAAYPESAALRENTRKGREKLSAGLAQLKKEGLTE